MFKEYYIHILKNILYQDKILLKNNLILKNINDSMIANTEIITKMETKLDKLIQQFEFINLFLVCLFILQIVLLFKIIS